MAGSKLGYDYDFVDTPPKSLECPICLLTLRDPHVISCCGNEFCQGCIEKVQRSGKPCPLCNEQNFTTLLHKKLVREVNELAVRCSNAHLGCEWTGELRQLEKHLNVGSTSEGCGYVVVDCIFECGARVQRRTIEDHERNDCPKRPVELQYANLAQKVEALSVELKSVANENKNLRQELDEVKEKNSHLENLRQELDEVKEKNSHLEILRQELDDVKKENSHLEDLRQELDEVKEKNSHLEKLRQELDEVKEKNSHLESTQESLQRICDDLRENQDTLRGEFSDQKTQQESKLEAIEEKCMSLHMHKAPLPLPPFYFSVRNVDQFQQTHHTFRSEPFFSHPGGYKMFLAVYPNYPEATHLSVYVSICRGEFDDQLKWPFDGKITVQAFNRTAGEWANEYTIEMNERKDGLSYVKRHVDIYADKGCGKPDYLSMAELKDYTKHVNVIRFRVAKVEICT